MRTFMCIFALTCATSLVLADGPSQAKEEDDIREATFRYQFQHNASGMKQNAKVYFLSLGEEKRTDPSDEFMKRFADHKPSVKKVSSSTGGPQGIKDKDTGEPGLIFRVQKIKWVDDTTAEVEGGYYEAGLSASGNTYYLKKEKDKWVVKRDVMHWIA